MVPPALADIGMIELLECDPRPTFILDLERTQDPSNECLHTVFSNASLQRLPRILNPVQVSKDVPADDDELGTYSQFKDWATSLPTYVHTTDDLPPPFEYQSLLWTGSTLKKRWRIISSSAIGFKDTSAGSFPSPPAGSQRKAHGMNTGSRGLPARKENGKLQAGMHPTWVDDLPISEHVQFFKSTDWSSTALGPLDTWSGCLRQMTRLLMSDSRGACIFWGPQRAVLYNEAYIAVASRKHPGLMGATLERAWAEVAKDLEPVFLTAERLGRATSMEDTPFYLQRHGYLEETFFSYNLIPVRAENGKTEGFYNAAFETTRQNIWERRTSTLLSIVSAPDMASYWREVLKGFESNERDIPLAVIYSLDSDMHDEAPTSIIHLQAALGVVEGHPLALKRADLTQGSETILPLLRKTISANCPKVFQRDNGSLPESLLHGIEWRGFGEPSNTLAVLPLTAGEETLGFLLMGLNPRRAYDDDYAGFIQLLNRQLSTSLTSAALMEQARRKQAELSKDLAEGESRFKTLTELNAGGLFYISPRGEVLYANDTWVRLLMTGLSRDEHSEMAFMGIIMEEDRPYVEQEWYNMSELKLKRTFEVRLTHKWHHKESGTWKNKWILASCGHDENEDGSLKSVMGSVTDISLLKQAQEDALERAALSEKLAQSQKDANEIQVRSRIEAEEARKSMEKFMDITSHEMRNPLSAILQSADGIAASLLEFRASSKTPIFSDELVESNLEAIQIISLCAQHQGRIINDVLTLSKLDSAMLLVSPTLTQPPVVVKGALKMFEGELVSHGIELAFSFEESYKRFGIDWVMIDPSRVTQILVNLMTNAIKFTKSREKREIKVSIGGSVNKPPGTERVNLEWFPSRGIDSKKDLTLDREWGEYEPLFVYFAVEDTGQGLSSEEKTRLFHRFAQANPRTHVKYGGSGLGLFISRELTELHGGEIGLYSEAGKGSTFAFYVKGRRASPPAEKAMQQLETQSAECRTASPIKPQRSQTDVPTKVASQSVTYSSQNKGDSESFQVLLVEDNLVNQKVLCKQLQKAGCTVHVANHGQEALDFMQSSNLWTNNPGGKAVDVVLMDLEMPIMDGLTCARRIRELQGKGTLIRHVPLIAVTANARKEQIETSLGAGMDDVMPKPFRVSELLTKMKALKLPE
ncbi:hypothetical protein HO173_012696 [Letharia columbiana]|uniref:Uncharacterized protein n=1 Tax=Letharia columbiana TaxID=112416 RepID=A0A8H6CME3_9LECA|nr:uncharacterized protein HO173_012696 [Letharia columbiana]KAF6225924.1 hypothetical protein HO173_012696 [Letharia columbiana]